MRVDASPESLALVAERGGRLYVWARRTRCCSGALTLLQTSSEPRGRPFRRVPAEGLELYLDERLREPEVLELDVGGLRHKHVHAYWNGCAYVV